MGIQNKDTDELMSNLKKQLQVVNEEMSERMYHCLYECDINSDFQLMVDILVEILNKRDALILDTVKNLFVSK